MKKIVLYAIAILLILCGCKKQPAKPADPTDSQTPTQTTAPSQPSETTTPTAPSTSTETTVTTETVVPTETVPKELTVADWQLEQPKYLSYEDYFSTEREFANVRVFVSTVDWIKGDQVYTLDYEIRFQRNKSEKLIVRCDESGEMYAVPGSGVYVSYEIAGADGHYGYLYNASRFVRLDLATGKAEVLLDGQNFCGCSDYTGDSFYLVDNLVAYYASYTGGELTIGRLYLPTLKHDILYKEQGEFYDLALNRPKTNQEPIVWTLKNPEFVNYLKAELADPNSKIQKGQYYDYSERWKEENAFSSIINSPMHLHYLQDAGNQRALLKCTLDLATNELTKQTGIVDNCFYGSGYPHNHFDTDVTTAPAPEVIMSDWTKIDHDVPFALLPTTDDSTVNDRIVKITDVDSQMYLYAKTDGDYKKISEVPIKMAVDTGTCAIYITADKKSVVAVSYDGTQSVELYRAVYDGIIDMYLAYYRKDRLIILDGDRLVEIDLSAAQHRELVKHPYLKKYYIDSVSQNGVYTDSDRIYFEVYVGMYYNAYTISMETGELKNAGYRL